MLKAIVTGLVAIVVVHLLGVIGLVGYAAVSGKLSVQRRELYKKVWDGVALVEPDESDEPVDEATEASSEQVTEQLNQARAQKELLTLDIQRHLEDLENMKRSVQAAQNKLVKDRTEYVAAMETFESQLERQNQAAKNEGFLRELDYFSRLKPKLAKEDFMAMSDDDAARFLAAMKPDVATKILNQFRSDAEQEKRQRVMALIETLGVVKTKGNDSNDG